MNSEAFIAKILERERSNRVLVKEHLRRYVPYFRGKDGIIDLGCGSGDFLELLKEEKISAFGVEENSNFVMEVKKRGLTVKKGKIQSFLKSCRPNSIGGFFISHVVEHLSPKEMINVMAGMQRALKPGGVLVLITPNPLSLGVMTHSFWRDPTHIRPYPLDFLVQLLESMELLVLAKGETCLGSKPSLTQMCVRKIRKLLVGDYFHDPDTYVVAQKI